ncbi:valine--tRNA ligase [Buchnera aphidicola]|uniref:valine--tRNA ligase n=1 Tax=Buchnera aphidicola TaxID=9 RepID=UPI0030EE9408
MKKIYNSLLFEKKVFNLWKKKKYFLINLKNSTKKNYCIMIPPPNITGNLHIGHAFQQTIMDIIIRYKKMLGKNVFWQVGLDHAGIATQLLIEKKYFFNNNKKNVKKKYRNKMKHKAFKWYSKIKQKIFYQMSCLGNFIDFKKSRFTLDKNFSKSVIQAFLKLYNKGLIYKKKKIVHWDTYLQTVISDLEIKNKSIANKLFYLKYFFFINNKKSKKYLTIATTRPETLLGDTAIAINPKDNRYINLKGLFVCVPLINRVIPIIFDDSVDMSKGTGCMKITPAHDFQDYEIALKNSLPIINIFKKDGTVRKIFKVYDISGKKIDLYKENSFIKFDFLSIKDLKKKIVYELKKFLYIIKIENCISNIPYGERSDKVIEPLLTTQWYLKISSFSKNIFKIFKKKYIKLIPKKYKKISLYWLFNMKDWCISRQSWWGHRLPIWYDKKKKVYVGKNILDIKKKYSLDDSIKLYQDKNVLDTWFSSSLWTFASLGWPKKTKELKFFHPTNVIISGFDIIFFWILKMVIMTKILLKNKDIKLNIPFKKVYITGLIKDENGIKMSKSKGNVIDLLDLIKGISLKKLLKKRTSNLITKNNINKILKSTKKQFPKGIPSYGADAVRFNCALLSTNYKSITWDLNKLKGCKNFCNKLWNASQFIKLNLKDKKLDFSSFKKNDLIYNKWIFYHLNKTIKLFTESIKRYRFDLAANFLYSFVWNKFCNWYLEISKTIIYSNVFSLDDKNSIYCTLQIILKNLLKLAHPIIPFITDYIWNIFNAFQNKKNSSIIIQKFPKYKKFYLKKKNFFCITWLKEIVIFVRQIRNDLNISKKLYINIIVNNPTKKFFKFLKKNELLLKNLLNLKKILIFYKKKFFKKYCLVKIIDTVYIYFLLKRYIKNIINISKLKLKYKKILKKIFLLKKILCNKNFLIKAPKDIITEKKKKLILLKNLKKNVLNYINLK